MAIKITSKHMDITDAIRNHIEERLSKLKKWHAQLINPHFILNKEPDGFSVDAIINTPLANLVANAKNDDMYQAINDVTVKLERQLDKSQHKHESKRGAKAVEFETEE